MASQIGKLEKGSRRGEFLRVSTIQKKEKKK
jgi:hypothetical protein